MSEATQGFQSNDKLIEHLQKSIKEWVAERDYFERVSNQHYDKWQSQKAITELKNAEIERLNELTGKDTRQIAYLLKELESQRAITELAVKGLKEISDGGSTGEDARDMRRTADYTLSEIARLSQ